MKRVAVSLLVAAAVTSFVYVPRLVAPSAHAANASATPADKPYKVEDGKVDPATYKGYLYYGDACMRCHGPDGAGSSYAPSLVDSLKSISKEQFEETVINGKKDVNTAEERVMPALGTNPDVVDNLDNIYDYLKARSDGALGRGHPGHLGE